MPSTPTGRPHAAAGCPACAVHRIGSPFGNTCESPYSTRRLVPVAMMAWRRCVDVCGLLPDQRDLQVRRPVLLVVEAAAIDVARAPKEHVVAQVDEVEFHEVA